MLKSGKIARKSLVNDFGKPIEELAEMQEGDFEEMVRRMLYPMYVHAEYLHFQKWQTPAAK